MAPVLDSPHSPYRLCQPHPLLCFATLKLTVSNFHNFYLSKTVCTVKWLSFCFIYLFLWGECAFMRACVRACDSECSQRRVSSSTAVCLTTLRQSFSQSLKSSLATPIIKRALRLCPSPSPNTRVTAALSHAGLHEDIGHSNSSAHACTKALLPTEPSL